jgi:hypothetical protein
MIIKCLNLMPKSSDPVIIVNINAKFIFIISRHKMYNADCYSTLLMGREALYLEDMIECLHACKWWHIVLINMEKKSMAPVT